MLATGNIDRLNGMVRTITQDTAQKSFTMLQLAGCSDLVAAAIVSVATTNKVHIGVGSVDGVPRFYSSQANVTFIVHDHDAQALKGVLEKVFKAGFTMPKTRGITDLSSDDIVAIDILRTTSTF